MVKKLLFCFSGEPLVFSVFSCFHFHMFSFLRILLLLIVIVHFTLSLLFLTYFVFVLLPRLLLIWENVFYSDAFFTLHSFPTFGTTCLYQVFPRAGSSALKVAGFPTDVRNTDPVHLFVWITQCSTTIW